jgi:chromosome segregation ATPase
MERLDLLQEKVEALMQQYARLKTELSVKEKVLQAKEEEVRQLKMQLTKAEERLLALEIGQAIPDAESRAATRQQLDTVIGEIDKILVSLHD